jgi:polyisoprenoid-binding protein YceI
MNALRTAFSVLALALALLLALVAEGQDNQFRKITANQKKSHITYFMQHPAHNWQGVSKEMVCNIAYNDAKGQIGQVGVSAPIASFDSKNSSRDSHALEVLDALKHPNVSFLSTKITENDGELSIEGNLTFHGITQPIAFKAQKTLKGKSLQVEGSFEVSLTQHQVERPSFLLVPTKDEVKISFVAHFDL